MVALFDRLEADLDDLTADTEAVAGLTYEGVVGHIKQSEVHRYTFDPGQEASPPSVPTPWTLRPHEADRDGTPYVSPGSTVGFRSRPKAPSTSSRARSPRPEHPWP